jgi:hypothetical protein
MSARWQDNEALLDLLVKEATEGLSAEEHAQLDEMMRNVPDGDRSAMLRSVALLWTSSVGKRQQMPAELRTRILASATSAHGPAGSAPPAGSASAESSAAGSVTSAIADNVTRFPERGVRRSGMAANAGWWAAAASLLLAIAGWWPRLVGDHPPPPVAQKTPVELRDELLAQQSTLHVSLTAASDQPLTGDVVFDPVNQVGFLRFHGIPVNDPRLAQYQLWIADAGRKQPEPVDGGVFDVTPQKNADGDVIVPFRAKLQVGKAAAFVVTMEQPGGVVVSKQERVLALAKVPAGT